jgi:dTDP-4-dehydrorhamnose 3,5-epimerase
MVCRERPTLSLPGAASGLGWRRLAAGGWLFDGKRFEDERGLSYETCDLTSPPSEDVEKFTLAQENLVNSEKAGCLRGLHYQTGTFAQAKLVTVVRGSAQLFWLPLKQGKLIADVHSAILSSANQSLFTPSDCAHGILTLEDNTLFLMKMSSPTVVAARREINLLSDQLSVSFARTIRLELRSERDRYAQHWSPQVMKG